MVVPRVRSTSPIPPHGLFFSTDDSMQHGGKHGPEDAQRLLREGWHEDWFDRAHSDEELEALVAEVASTTRTPHVEILRRMVGIDELDEAEAKLLFRRVVEHRRRLSKALGRAVHVRVAALDWLTTRKRHAGERETHPIVVTPSLIERALEKASADPVTGLPQRAHFVNLVKHELRQRRRRNVAVAFVDLDGFKRVNDTFGHARGDDVLRMLASVARVTLRTGDVIARMGGDEFALLLLDVNPHEADAIVRRLRARFEARTERYGTSFSAGIALVEAGDTPESILVRADAKMYRNKRSRASSHTSVHG